MSAFVDEERERFGVEPICRELEVSPSAYYQRRTGPLSRRAHEDAWLSEQIRRVHKANYEAYGSRRMWKAMRREDVDVGRDRIRRLMRAAGLQGAKRRGRPWRTTIPDPAALRPPDLVERDFATSRPDELWVCDFTYGRCWEGVVYFAFVKDAYSRMICGWQFATHMRTELVLDALEMALWARHPDGGLIHHSDQGSQGGLNWSLQRLIERSCDGQEGSGLGACGSAGDVVAGASAGRATRTPGAVLGGDRARTVERGCWGGGGCVAGGRRPVVSGGWRHAVRHGGPGVGAVFVVR